MPDTQLSVSAHAEFEQLYRRYGGRVLAYALRRSSPAIADDVVADVFLVAWRRVDELPAEPLPWLLGVARKVLANRRRGEQRVVALQHRLASEHGGGLTGGGDDEVDERVGRALRRHLPRPGTRAAGSPFPL